MPQEPSEAAASPASQPNDGQFDISAERILERVQQDPVGVRIVQTAVQACVIEDQQTMIKALRAELVSKNNPDSTDD